MKRYFNFRKKMGRGEAKKNLDMVERCTCGECGAGRNDRCERLALIRKVAAEMNVPVAVGAPEVLTPDEYGQKMKRAEARRKAFYEAHSSKLAFN